MNEKQVDEVASGIMGNAVAEQVTSSVKRKAAEENLQLRRKLAMGGLLGLVVGLAVGYIGFNSFMPAGLFGTISGMLFSRWLNNNR